MSDTTQRLCTNHIARFRLFLVYILYKCKKQSLQNGRRRSCTSKTANIHCFVRFVMYCIITTVPVAFYWAGKADALVCKLLKIVQFLANPVYLFVFE